MNMEVVIVIEWIASILAIAFGVWGLLYSDIQSGSTHEGVKAKAIPVGVIWALVAVFGLIAFLGAYVFDYNQLQSAA